MPRVLVVDGSADATESLSLMLRLWGHEVRTANDGASALAQARELRPDVTLLEVSLPGMDGYEVARRLRSLPGVGGGIIVALTGLTGEPFRRRACQAGFDLYLPKPAWAAELKQLLDWCPAGD